MTNLALSTIPAGNRGSLPGRSLSQGWRIALLCIRLVARRATVLLGVAVRSRRPLTGWWTVVVSFLGLVLVRVLLASALVVVRSLVLLAVAGRSSITLGLKRREVARRLLLLLLLRRWLGMLLVLLWRRRLRARWRIAVGRVVWGGVARVGGIATAGQVRGRRCAVGRTRVVNRRESDGSGHVRCWSLGIAWGRWLLVLLRALGRGTLLLLWTALLTVVLSIAVVGHAISVLARASREPLARQ